jgi:excisionase family DNA binding protein
MVDHFHSSDAAIQTPVPQLLLTGREAARAVGLCEKSLYLAARRGELRVVKLGRSVRYRLADLEEWIQSKLTPGVK